MGIVYKKLDIKDPFIANLISKIKKSSKKLNQTEIAKFLDKRGYVSVSGIRLTESHISNFLRSNGIRYVAIYHKPNYQGKHWQSYRGHRNISVPV